MVGIVTGGSKGIGLAIARGLLDRGMQVTISGRGSDDLRKAVEQLAAGDKVLRDIFARVPVSPDDVLVDIGSGEGRVINFWLSRGWKNPIIGIESVEAVADNARKRYRKYSNVSIVTGDAVANLPRNGTLFFLYNPFGDRVVAQFEQAIRPLNARVVFHQNNYMEPFQSDDWRIEPLNSKGTVYEFKAALISKRAA